MSTTAATERWALVGIDFAVDTVWGMTVARGRVHRASGSYQVGPEGAELELTVDVASIEVGEGLWANVLRSAAAEYPQARFTSTGIRDAGNGKLYVSGRLAAAGKVVPVEFVASADRVGRELRLAATVDQNGLSVDVSARFAPQ